jgi:hypothetical protein
MAIILHIAGLQDRFSHTGHGWYGGIDIDGAARSAKQRSRCRRKGGKCVCV